MSWGIHNGVGGFYQFFSCFRPVRIVCKGMGILCIEKSKQIFFCLFESFPKVIWIDGKKFINLEWQRLEGTLLNYTNIY